MQTTTANYQAEEAKNVGAKPQIQIAFMRTVKELVDADFADDSTSDCVHTNTEYIDSTDILQLADAEESSGQLEGNWVSEVFDSGHLTPNIIYDKITWTETLNGGTVTMQLRSANTIAGVSTAEYTTYTNGTLDHTERFRYYQLKVSFIEGSSSPTVTTIKIRHKALIPRTDYSNPGSIRYGLDIDFLNCTAGNISIIVDSKNHQFNKHQTTSYIYGINYYYEMLEIWAGFQLSDLSTEWLLQFIGEIENIKTSSGQGQDNNAIITARDFIYKTLTKTIIGRPTSSGTPQPYMSGKRYRVPCKETDADNYVYSFYCQQSITSIDAVYIRNTTNQKWVTAPSNTPNATAKTITFDADPESEVAVDITINTTDHPCDIIDDILANEISLDSDYYDSTGITTTIKNRISDLVVGVSFENISAYQALLELAKSIDGAPFVERGIFKIKQYWPTLTSNKSFGESDLKSTIMTDSLTEIQNTISCFYGDYDDNKTDYVEISDDDSVNDYGNLTKDVFDFRYQAPVSITSPTIIQSILGHWMFRQQYQAEIYRSKLRLESLRLEIFDIIDITDTKHNLSSNLMLLLFKTINLDNFSSELNYIRYPEINWAFASDDGDTEDLYYAVDDVDTDTEFHCYAW